MKNRKPKFPRRGSLLILIVLSGLATGCTDAILDAAAAGGLSFIQNSVTTALTGIVFPDSAASMDSDSMGDTMSPSSGGHAGHGE